MAYKISGTVLLVTPTQTLTSAKTGNVYSKRDLIITVRLFDPYTGQPSEMTGNTPKFTFIGERCKELDQFKPGDIVCIYFDINGRSYVKEGRTDYITEVRPYKVEFSRPNTQQPQAVQQPQTAQQQPTAALSNNYQDNPQPNPTSATFGEELPF